MDFKAAVAFHQADPDLSSQGALLDFGEFQLLVARWGNPAFARAVQKAARRLPLGDRENRREINKLLASTILVGWRNLEENGAPLPYSVERAEELLNSADLLQEEVIRFAQNENNYRAAAVAAGADALKKSSAGG